MGSLRAGTAVKLTSSLALVAAIGPIMLGSCSTSTRAARATAPATHDGIDARSSATTPSLRSEVRDHAVETALSDVHVRTLAAPTQPRIARVTAWTRAVPGSTSPFTGVVVTVDLPRARSLDAVWPSWACSTRVRAYANGVVALHGVGIDVHVVADNVSQILVGLDSETRRVIFIEPGPQSDVRVWSSVGKPNASFPLIECDDDDPQLAASG